jgi:uncharacterized membrane protein
MKPLLSVPEGRLAAAREPNAFLTYVGRIREFTARDWWVYVAWVGLMLGLVLSTSGFVIVGHAAHAPLPAEAYWVPWGALIFTVSIAIDTIGHRTIYKQEIQKAEGLVHGITIFCGISSCICLTAAYQQRGVFWIPALTLTILSMLYSLVDEVFHWRRYVTQQSDPVEMWCHVGILAGHFVMMTAWWCWFYRGYVGVAETLTALAAL